MAGNKNSGRTPGALNRQNITVLQLCNELGYNPVKKLYQLSKSEDEGIQLGAAKELIKYCYPQLKAMEITGGLTMDMWNLSIEDLEQQTRQLENLLGIEHRAVKAITG